MHLTDFNLLFISQKSIKGQVIINYLTKAPSSNDNPLIIELLYEHVFQLDEMEIPIEFEEDWDMVIYFDGSRCEQSGGASVVFITPQGVPIPYSFKLNFPCTNNNVEYEALITMIKISIQ